MKLVYYSYYFEQDDGSFRYNMLPALHAFAAGASTELRRSIVIGHEHLYIFPAGDGPVILLVVERDNELMKAIGEDARSAQDIADKLGSGELPGVASYLHIGPDWFGVAAPLMGPRASRFTGFVRTLLDLAGFTSIAIRAVPLRTSVTCDEARSFFFKGEISFRVRRGYPIFDGIIPAYGAPEDTQYVQVRFCPVRRQQQRQAFDRAVDAAERGEIDHLTVKAKRDIADKLSEYHVIGTGGISIEIDSSSERTILAGVKDGPSNDENFEIARSDYWEGRECPIENDHQSLRGFADVDRWRSTVARGATPA